MDTLYTFLDDKSYSKTKSVHFCGLMNSATKFPYKGIATWIQVPEKRRKPQTSRGAASSRFLGSLLQDIGLQEFGCCLHPIFRGPQNRDIPTLLGFIIRGFVWDIPILIFAYVLFGGPI